MVSGPVPQEKSMPRRPLHRHPLRRFALIGFLSTVGVLAMLVALSAADTGPVAGPSAPVAAAEAAAEGLDADPTPVAAAIAASVPVLPEPPPLEVLEGVLAGGSSLAAELGERGVPPRTVHVISEEMSPYFDFRHARAGHEYRLTRNLDGDVLSFDYRTSPDAVFHLERTDDGFRVEERETELLERTTMIAGLVTSTLYGAIKQLGEQGGLAHDFADIFAWDIDFSRSVRPGDAFQIVYERLYRVAMDGTETYVRPGRILAARYDGAAGRHTAFYFEVEPGRGGYYRANGESVEGEFLMVPLRHARITSVYTNARRHPILKVTRPHQGIDYAAPAGEPVWAVADGEVIYRGRAGGFGNLVKVRHRNGVISYYSHLSKFGRGLRVGQRVEQKQVVGYVGQTGLATGPHVCFRIQKDGKYVNPATLRKASRAAIPKELLQSFHAARAQLAMELDGGGRVARQQAMPQGRTFAP